MKYHIWMGLLFYMFTVSTEMLGQNCVAQHSTLKDNPVSMDDGSILWASTDGVLLQHDVGIDVLAYYHNGRVLDGRVVSVFKLDSNLLIHFEHHGLLHVTPHGQSLLAKSEHPDSAPGGLEINSILQLGDTVILGSTQGISLYDLKQRKIVYHIRPADRAGLPENPQGYANAIQTVIHDRDQGHTVWIAGNSGLFRMHWPDCRITYIPFDIELMKRNNLFNPGFISMLLSDGVQLGNELFFSSWGGGVISFHLVEHVWQMYRYDLRPDINPMAFNIVTNLDQWNDSLLLCTRRDQSPAFFDTSTRRFRSLKEVTGIQGRKEKSRGILRVGNTFHVAYKSVICQYEGDKYFLPISRKPHIQLGAIKSYTQELGLHNGFQYHIFPRLEKFQRTVDITFFINDIDDTAESSVECRLSGVDQDWRPLPASGDITYTNLKGGHHTLEGRIVPADGTTIYSSPYHFYIKKYFWEEYWFYVLIGIGILALSLPLYLYWHRQQREKRASALQHQRELSDTRLAALRAQMNPHFLFNSLSAINHHIIQADPRTASKYLTKFAHLMRRILNNSQKGFITLEEELSTLRLYLEMEQLRYDHALHLVERVDHEVDSSHTYIPTMLLQPYIENAILHGIMNKKTAGTIELTIDLESSYPEKLRITIIDDGIGRERAMEMKASKVVKNKSLGLELTKNRIDLLRARFQIEATINIEDKLDSKGQVSGTSVTLILPFLTEQDVNVHA